MPEGPLATPALPLDLAGATALARASAAFARLDQALAGHPLAPAFLYRARLEAVRRQAAVDGHAIDPWHLAAILEGLRLRMELSLSMLERAMIFEAARHAFDQYQWLVTPDFDQEGEVQEAEATLAAIAGPTPLLVAAQALHGWLDRGRDRTPMRAALVRFWKKQKLLRAPVPLTGAAALRAEGSWAPGPWAAAFLNALANEAEHGLQLLLTLERAWLIARRQAGGQRSTSRAALAIDVLAAAPLVSATSLSTALGMAVKNSTLLLEKFCAARLVVEVTHRAKRRLFGLAELAPLRDGVAAPRRPEPGRGRGRPRILLNEPEEESLPLPLPAAPLAPLTPIERQEFDYSGLEGAMALADAAVRNARLALARQGSPTTAARAEKEEAEADADQA